MLSLPIEVRAMLCPVYMKVLHLILRVLNISLKKMLFISVDTYQYEYTYYRRVSNRWKIDVFLSLLGEFWKQTKTQ